MIGAASGSGLAPSMETGSVGAGAPPERLGNVPGVPSSRLRLARPEVPVLRVAVEQKGGLAVNR